MYISIYIHTYIYMYMYTTNHGCDSNLFHWHRFRALLPKLPLRPPGLLVFNCPALLAPAQKTSVFTCIFTGLACSVLWCDWPTIGQSAKCQDRAQNCPAHCIYIEVN